METQVKKEQIVKNLSNCLSELMVRVAEVASKKKYLIKIDDEEQLHLEFLTFKTEHLTQTSKKKIAKRVYHLLNKSGYKSLSNFFEELKYRGVINYIINIDISEKEKQIQKFRKEFVISRNAFEKARLNYSTEKGDFYK